WPGLLSANTYNSLMPASYWQFIQAIGDPWRERRGGGGLVYTERADSPLLPLLGVRWLVSRQPLDSGAYRNVLRGTAYYVYELDRPMPRAYAVDEKIDASSTAIKAFLTQLGARE